MFFLGLCFIKLLHSLFNLLFKSNFTTKTAGFDTTSSAITLAAYQLARHPEVQEKLYAEIVATLAKLRAECPDRDNDDPFELVTYDTLTRFEYLLAVVDESLRIDSPAIFIERCAANDIELANADGTIRFQVKRGDIVHIPVYSMHLDEKYFPNAEGFEPNRFLASSNKDVTTASVANKSAYLAFGSGARMCPARGFALFEARLALLHLIRNFRFEMCATTPTPLSQFYNQFDVISPKSCPLRIVKRER